VGVAPAALVYEIKILQVTQGHSRSFKITPMSNNNNNNNNNNNKHDNVYGAVIMAEPLREFIRFI